MILHKIVILLILAASTSTFKTYTFTSVGSTTKIITTINSTESKTAMSDVTATKRALV